MRHFVRGSVEIPYILYGERERFVFSFQEFITFRIESMEQFKTRFLFEYLEKYASGRIKERIKEGTVTKLYPASKISIDYISIVK